MTTDDDLKLLRDRVCKIEAEQSANGCGAMCAFLLAVAFGAIALGLFKDDYRALKNDVEAIREKVK